MLLKLFHLVACVLTALPSGAALRLPRFALVSAATDALPLDDPKTDFVTQGQSGTTCSTEQSLGGGMARASASPSPMSFWVAHHFTTGSILLNSISFLLLTP